jgi:cyclophilin family peptidyl-prolyl cis-trans isomerase
MKATIAKFTLAALLLTGVWSAAQAGPQVLLETSEGNIRLELDAEAAPQTVENFLAYVDAGFYDGTLFHRVIKGFMIQGGGFTPEMQRKETRDPIQNEADNGLKNRRGTIAMARTGDPDSATAQFFINLVDNGFLNHSGKSRRGWGYCVFGEVVEGMEVVDRIAETPTGIVKGMKDVPKTPVLIERASRIETGEPKPAAQAPAESPAQATTAE